jgi:hypothetical protein
MKKPPNTIFAITVASVLASAVSCSGQLDVGDSGTGGGADESSSSGGNDASGGAPHAGGTGGLASTGGSTSEGGSASGGRSSGGGASGGSSSGGAAGGFGGELVGGTDESWLDQFDPVEAVSLSSEGCPMGPLRPDSLCASSGLVCGYEFEENYQECTCLHRSFGSLNWDCSYAEAHELCGETVPEPGADCYGVVGLVCFYPPGIECTCGGQMSTWECTNMEPGEITDPPSSVDTATTVADMTDEDLAAWCEWYSTNLAGAGRLPVEDLDVEDGFTKGGGCASQSQAPCRVTMPVLSVSQCMAHLALSECSLPVATLSECFETSWAGPCGVTDLACANYLVEPSCNGTLFRDQSGSPSCEVRVE